MPVGISAAIIVPFVVIAFNVNRLSLYIRKWFGQFIETRFGTWLALKVDKGLGRLTKEREETLLRRRDNRIRKRKERRKEESPTLDPPPTPVLPATEEIGNGNLKEENIPEKDGSDDANGPVRSWSLNQALRSQRLPTIDEENQGRTTRAGQTKANTFPIQREPRKWIP